MLFSLQAAAGSSATRRPHDDDHGDVVAIARIIRSLCARAGVTPFVKTSGASGLHVLLPLQKQLSYEESRTLAGLVGRLVVREAPEIATMAPEVVAFYQAAMPWLHLGSASRLSLGHISAISRPHLGYISATSRPHLGYI